jgi:hypothetical protein
LPLNNAVSKPLQHCGGLGASIVPAVQFEGFIYMEHYIFVVFYRHHGEDYSAVFQGMRAAKQFARTTGGRVETQLSNMFKDVY